MAGPTVLLPLWSLACESVIRLSEFQIDNYSVPDIQTHIQLLPGGFA